uniref:Uncharacterized protein n=1 Tax=Arundo donax TaxID=35708 RepID=A0A0A9GHV9_ARUDO
MQWQRNPYLDFPRFFSPSPGSRFFLHLHSSDKATLVQHQES